MNFKCPVCGCREFNCLKTKSNESGVAACLGWKANGAPCTFTWTESHRELGHLAKEHKFISSENMLAELGWTV